MTARRRGDTTEALRLLDEFIRTYPQAPLAQDARIEQFRSLVEGGDRAAASRAANQYLYLYPDGFAQDEARALR
jgi:outer membrane protein assembly factor BamD (BamD/ComL family)